MMTKLRGIAGFTAIALVLVVGIFPTTALCVPPQSAPMLSSGNKVHLTLRGKDGLERLVFSHPSGALSSDGELHLVGSSRSRGGRPGAVATLSLSGNHGWLFFSGHRSGQPSAAHISFSRERFQFDASITKVSRARSTPLRCSNETSTDVNIQPTASKALSPRAARPFSPPRVIEVATLADYDFFLAHGKDSNAYIRAVLHATQEIYTKQLGLTFRIVQQEVESSGSPSSREASAENLLEAFRRSAVGATSRADVRHLFTGKRLDGLTIGIAYIAAACTARGQYSVGISRGVSDALQPILAAHEIGHNLSAVHDSGSRSIMNPSITSANDRFLPSTVDEIHDFVSSSGSCLTPESLTQPTLRVATKMGERFSASVKFTTARSLSCQTTLLGSENGTSFITLASKRTARTRANAANTVVFRADAPPLDSPHTFYFKTKVSCGGSRGRSTPQSLTYHSGSGNTLVITEGGRWLGQLRNNLR